MTYHEFYAAFEGEKRHAWREYYTYKDIIPWHDENGILYVGIEQFLLEENAIDI